MKIQAVSPAYTLLEAIDQTKMTQSSNEVSCDVSANKCSSTNKVAENEEI
jgi:hypothetical protein